MKQNSLSGPKYLIVFRSIINDHDKILLLKRANNRDYNPGKWELPGGKLGTSEDVSATVESVIERETSLIVKPTARRYYYHSRYVSERGKYYGYSYIEITGEADYVAGDVKIGGDHQDFAWVDFKDIFKFDLSLESKKALTLYVSELRDATAINEPGKIPVVLSARALIKNKKGEYLIVKRTDRESFPGKWELPGGKLSSFENLNELLKREVFEETGLVVRVTEQNAYINSHVVNEGKYRGFTFINIVSFAEAIAGNVKLSEENTRYKWVKQGELLNQDLADYVKLPLTEIFLKESGSTVLPPQRHRKIKRLDTRKNKRSKK